MVAGRSGDTSAPGSSSPPLEIRFHDHVRGCGGYIARYHVRMIDICAKEPFDATIRSALLHEMAHGWTSANMDLADRQRFLVLRNLASWNSAEEPWARRGWEQASELLAWGVGDQTQEPSISDDSSDELAAAYELMTGQPLPGRRPGSDPSVSL